MFVCAECGQRYERGGYCAAEGRPLVASDDPLLGSEIGRYRLAQLIGEGGMGRVYLAVQPMIGSRVAIKVLADQCARNPELLDRFFAEARAVNLIRHENIVSVIDLAKLDDGRPYIIMEYIEGRTLAQLVHTEPAPLGGIVQVMTEVLSALSAAHAIGIVHRDLKPDNILVTGEGHAKVLDFGIAKLSPGLSQQSPRTRTGALLGTPAYMAPEQISGGGQIDARTDVYAAGVVLFEAVCGRVPFQSETLFELMRDHLEQAPPRPRQFRADLPPVIEEVILQALAKAPEHRFQTAAAMAQALNHAAVELAPEHWRALSSRGGMITGGIKSITRVPLHPPMNTPTVADRAASSSATRQGRAPNPRDERTRNLRPSQQPLLDSNPPPYSGEQSAQHRPESAPIGRPSVAVPSAAPRRSRMGIAIGFVAACALGGGILALVLANRGDGSTQQVASSASNEGSSPSGASNDGSSNAASNGGAANDGAKAGDGSSKGGAPNAGSSNAGSSNDGSSNATAKSAPPARDTVGGSLSDAASAAKTPADRAHKAKPTRTAQAPATTPTPATTPAPAPAKAPPPATTPAAPAKPDPGSVSKGSNVQAGSNVVSGSSPPPSSSWPRFQKPIDYNPRDFNAVAYIPKAAALARTLYPDAILTRFDVHNVYPDGHADLSLGGDSSYLFRSPSHSARPSNIPSNLEVDVPCYVEVTVGSREVDVRVRDQGLDESCHWVARQPRCTMAGVWEQAKLAGAKIDTIAKVALLSDGKWWFDNEFHGQGIATSFPNACP